jgi:glycosyltransferase involved in cell wall biosynthesis
MKICLVSQEYPPETARGGIGTQTYFKAHGLASRGHEVCVLSRTSEKGMVESFDKQVRVIRIPDAELPIAQEPARWLSYSARVASELLRLRSSIPFDLIDFPEYAGEGYVYLLNRTEWNHVPVVIQIHGPVVMFADKIGWPEKNSELYRVGKEMEGTSLRLADGVFSSSHCSTQWCAEHYGLNAQAVPRIHTGVDPDVFYPMDVPKYERPTIVFAGKISEAKGIKYLVDAALQLAVEMPDLRLCVLGRGESQFVNQLKKKAAGAGFPDLLDLQGFVTHQEMREYFSKSHVFAATSVYEAGPGLVNLEAMACGLPVVASEGSGATEVVMHGENGFLTEPGNPESIKAAIKRILSSEDLRNRMSKRAREFIQREALRSDCIDKLECFYHSVTVSKARAS